MAAERRESGTLKAILSSLAELPTRFHHLRSGKPINGFEFLHLRYRGSPADQGSNSTRAWRLAEILNEAEYAYGPEGASVMAYRIGRALGNLKKAVAASAENAIASGELDAAPNWRAQVLPRPDRYEPGQILAAFHPPDLQE